MDWLGQYPEVWAIDFEFSAPPGERPTVVCLVARELHSGRSLRFDQDQLATMDRAPFDTGTDSLVVAYYASAEAGCFLSLGWDLPANVLDLFVEFKNKTNGKRIPTGSGLLGCLTYHGFPSILLEAKQEMRALAMAGGPYTSDEMIALLDYCQTDVDALIKLLPKMIPTIDFPRALLRGRYMNAVANMEHVGIPIDVETLELFRRHWDTIKLDLIQEIDEDYGVYEGPSFRSELFEAYLIREGIAWERTDAGRLKTDSDTFRSMSRSYPQLLPLYQLRHMLSEMKLEALEVGADGRNRTMLSPFRAKTSRNQPSNTKFAFGPSAWLRGLIKPEPGMALAYIDYGQQELAIAAALSGDPAMAQAYHSGDPYMEFARMAGAVPPGATKQSHPKVRAMFKQTMLATQYGMTEHGLALRLGCSTAEARSLLRKHHETFHVFWDYSDEQTAIAMLTGTIQTVFGWTLHTGSESNGRSLGNFPMQANGAEMLRLAICLGVEASIQVAAPVHDAVLIMAPIGEIEAVSKEMQNHMLEASKIVLDGFGVGTDVKVVKYPTRYMDEDRGQAMWDKVVRLANRAESRSVVA